MATKEDKDFVKEITKMEDDFPQWYTDVIRKTDLVDYSPVKGFMVIKPYGYALWEGIQTFLDKKFKETGHQNMYFPLLIPESLLTKEKEHVEGFAPEVAWVTHGGSKELSERLCVRPTSETIICSMYSKWLKSYRELPYLYNQWCSVVRWEKETRPFLRTSEFLWQEGHTLHETAEEAQNETLQMLSIYKDLLEKFLAIPVITGEKSEKEKFAGAYKTYTIEAMMKDGKALQAGTSHNLADHFTKAFDITYLDRNGKLEYPYHTSWGVSTRLIGALIMVHGDNRGLVLPPKIAPTQVVIVPIIPRKDEISKQKVIDKCYEIFKLLKDNNIRVQIDDSESVSPGWKFNEYEMKGIPLRIELGAKELEKNQFTLFRRDNLEKESFVLDNVEKLILDKLEEVQENLYIKALKKREDLFFDFTTYDEFKERMSKNPGFCRAMWCGDRDIEDKIKEETGATIRCIPFEQEILGEKCSFSDRKAKYMVILAKSY